MHLDTINKLVKTFPGEIKGQNLTQNQCFSDSTACKMNPVSLERHQKSGTDMHLGTRNMSVKVFWKFRKIYFSMRGQK